MKLFRSWLALAVCAVALTVGHPAAHAVETKADEAIVLDDTTGEVLYAKHPDRRVPPASMSKIMTAYTVFHRLAESDLTLSDTFEISEKAWRKGGSKMFVEVGNEVSVEDLLRGVIVQSGNDATVVVAEGLAGSEEAFAHGLFIKRGVFEDSNPGERENHAFIQPVQVVDSLPNRAYILSRSAKDDKVGAGYFKSGAFFLKRKDRIHVKRFVQAFQCRVRGGVGPEFYAFKPGPA